MQRKDLKVLLFQVREDQTTLDEELNEFIRFGKLTPEQIDVWNVFEKPDVPENAARGYDAVFIGGSSDASVLEKDKYPFVTSLGHALKYAAEEKIPVLASCFGFQVAIQEFGGEIVEDVENREVGTYDISLTEEGKVDALMSTLPNPLKAVCGHKLRAASLPENFINLAWTPQCPFHAFKIKDVPFYGFQFHPEIDKNDLVARSTRYMDRYHVDGVYLKRIIDNAEETPEANALVSDFIDKIVIKK